MKRHFEAEIRLILYVFIQSAHGGELLHTVSKTQDKASREGRGWQSAQQACNLKGRSGLQERPRKSNMRLRI